MEKSNKQKQLTPEQIHEKQFWLEIILPIGLVLLVFIGLVVLAISLTGRNAGAVSQWADVSIILLVMPVLLIVLVNLALVILINILLGKWNKSFPPLLFLGRIKVEEFASKLRSTLSVPATPVIKIKSVLAGIQQFFASLTQR